MTEQQPAASASGLAEFVIRGRRYRLRGSDPEVLRALAARVDATMADLAGPVADKDDFKVAVLAALNLAADHEEERAAWLDLAQQIAHQARDAEGRLRRLAEAL